MASPCIFDGQEAICCIIWTGRAYYSMPDALINSHGPSIPLAINYTLWPGHALHFGLPLNYTMWPDALYSLAWPDSMFYGPAIHYALWSDHAFHSVARPCYSFYVLGQYCFTIESCILVSHFHTVHFVTYSQQTVYEFIFEFFLIFFLLWLIKFIQSKFVILSNGSLLFRIIK